MAVSVSGSLDVIEAFIEQHRAGSDEAATALYHDTLAIREIARVLGRFAYVISTFASCNTELDPAVDEVVNLTRTLAISLYLTGYRAGSKKK